MMQFSIDERAVIVRIVLTVRFMTSSPMSAECPETRVGATPALSFLQCFDTVGWVIWPIKPIPDMTYNVFGGTLNVALSIYPAW